MQVKVSANLRPHIPLRLELKQVAAQTIEHLVILVSMKLSNGYSIVNLQGKITNLVVNDYDVL